MGRIVGKETDLGYWEKWEYDDRGCVARYENSDEIIRRDRAAFDFIEIQIQIGEMK